MLSAAGQSVQFGAGLCSQHQYAKRTTRCRAVQLGTVHKPFDSLEGPCSNSISTKSVRFVAGSVLSAAVQSVRFVEGSL